MPGDQTRPAEDIFPVAGAHHDGCAVYVSNPFPEPGSAVTLRVDVAPELAATRVSIRCKVDGDQQLLSVALFDDFGVVLGDDVVGVTKPPARGWSGAVVVGVAWCSSL